MPGIAGGKQRRAERAATLRAGTPREHDRRDHRLLRRRTSPASATSTATAAAAAGATRCERDPQTVLDDVLDEYVSVEAARRDYGVVLTRHASRRWTSPSTTPRPTALRAERRIITDEDRTEDENGSVCRCSPDPPLLRVSVCERLQMSSTASALTSAARSPTSCSSRPDGSIRARRRVRRTAGRPVASASLDGIGLLAERRGSSAARRCWRSTSAGRARHDHRRQHDDRDERRGDRSDHHAPGIATRSSCAAASRRTSGIRPSRRRRRSRRAGAASACRSGSTSRAAW